MVCSKVPKHKQRQGIFTTAASEAAGVEAPVLGQIGGGNVPGEIVMIAPTPETCREWGHEYTPRDDGLLAYISHPKGGTGAKPRRHTYTYAHIEHDLHCSVYRGGVSYGG